jgi:predicted histone-like DNA-binding protein
MKYKLTKETKPRLATFGKYKATAVHGDTVDTRQILKEVSRRNGFSIGELTTAMMGLSDVINEHLRRGDKVRLDKWGLMKLEIESDKVDTPEEFRASKHIRGVRLHFLPESTGGHPDLYKDIRFERERQR